VWCLTLALVLGAIMPIEGTEGLSLVLTNKVGNRAISELGAVWTPWPNDLWTIVKGAPYECPRVDTWSDHHFYYPYPVAIEGGHRSEIEYTTDGNEAFNLTDDSVCFRWRPPVNDGDPDYYASFGLADGSTDILVEIEVAAGGGSPELTQLSTPPYPYSTAPASYDLLHAAEWSPDGDYLCVGGYNNDYDEFFAWYKDDGAGGLTKLTNPSTMPTGAYGLAWDANSEYLAVLETANWGTNNRIYLYKRTGDTLTHKQTIDFAYEGGIGSGVWSGSYLILGAFEAKTYAPWGGGDECLAVYSRTGDTLTFGSSYALNGRIETMALNPDGDYLAISYTDYDPARLNDPYIAIYGWDGAGTLTYKDRSPTEYSDYYEVNWDATGVYIAVAMRADYNGWGFNLKKWDVGTETMTDITPTDDILTSHGSAQNDGYGAMWHPIFTDYLFVTGNFFWDWPGDLEAMVTVYKRTGDVMEKVLEGPDVFGETWAYPWRAAIHPSGDYIAIPYMAGDLLRLYGLSGFTGGGSDPQLKITVDANTPVIVSPYSTATHRWLRISHTSSGDVIVVDTAGTDCSGWTERASLPLASGNVVNALAITVNAWSDHNVADAGAPDPGYYGPFGPLGEELYLTLTNAVQTIYQEGEDGLIFTLTNEVGDY